MEDTVYNADGLLASRGHAEYDIPSMADCPPAFNVTLLKSRKLDQQVLYSSKGVGEPPYLNGLSVYFAIKDAVLSARKEAGLLGKFSLKMPTTPDNIRQACKEKTA